MAMSLSREFLITYLCTVSNRELEEMGNIADFGFEALGFTAPKPCLLSLFG